MIALDTNILVRYRKVAGHLRPGGQYHANTRYWLAREHIQPGDYRYVRSANYQRASRAGSLPTLKALAQALGLDLSDLT